MDICAQRKSCASIPEKMVMVILTERGALFYDYGSMCSKVMRSIPEKKMMVMGSTEKIRDIAFDIYQGNRIPFFDMSSLRMFAIKSSQHRQMVISEILFGVIPIWHAS